MTKTKHSESMAALLLSLCGLFLFEYGIYTTFGEGWAMIFGGLISLSVAGMAGKNNQKGMQNDT